MQALLLILIMFLTLASCGETYEFARINRDTKVSHIPPVGSYIPIARAYITVKKGKSGNIVKALKFLSPVSTAYAAVAAAVTYVSIANTTFVVDTSTLVPVLSGDANTLDLGSVTVTDLKTNQLKICGVGGNQKCTEAIIRVYTTELAGFAGISGFVNKDDSYGVDLFSGKGIADQLTGLDAIGSVTVQSFVIVANDKKLSLADFPSPTYLVEVDFSNAGAGNYEVTYVIELALGL